MCKLFFRLSLSFDVCIPHVLCHPDLLQDYLCHRMYLLACLQVQGHVQGLLQAGGLKIGVWLAQGCISTLAKKKIKITVSLEGGGHHQVDMSNCKPIYGQPGTLRKMKCPWAFYSQRSYLVLAKPLREYWAWSTHSTGSALSVTENVVRHEESIDPGSESVHRRGDGFLMSGKLGSHGKSIFPPSETLLPGFTVFLLTEIYILQCLDCREQLLQRNAECEATLEKWRDHSKLCKQ